MFSQIVFDFDGVLADTESLLFSIFQLIHPSVTLQDFKSHHEGNIYLEPKIMMSEADMEVVFTEYRQKLTEKYCPNIRKIITAIPEKIPLFIISSNDDTAIKNLLKSVGLFNRFSAVLGRDAGKSKQDKFKYIADHFKQDLAQGLFVTDTLGDLNEALAFDISTVAVLWGFHDKQTLAKGEPKYFVETPEELCKILSMN